MSYSLFQTIMYAFGGTVNLLACMAIFSSSYRRKKLDKYRLMSVPMISFVIITILHFAAGYGKAFKWLHFLGEFQTNGHGTIMSGSIFGRAVTLTKAEGYNFDVNAMTFPVLAIAPMIGFAILTRKSIPAA